MRVAIFFSVKMKKRKELTGEFFAPLAGLTYSSQLAMKQKTTRKFQDEVRRELREKCAARRYPVPAFDPRVDEIVHLPESLEISFRNKCEFTFGPEAALGFVKRVGSCDFHIEPITAENPLVPPAMRAVVDALRSGLQEFPAYDRAKHSSGLLRTAAVRMGDQSKMSLLVQVKKWPNEEISRLKDKLKEIVGDERLGIVSLWIQENSGLSDACHSPPEFLWGDSRGVAISVCGLKFQAHPMSFFQTNTRACEMLYSLVSNWAAESLEGKLLLLDICCGVGTIGQVVAKQLLDSEIRVLGIEMVPEAVEDARLNAHRNFGDSASMLHFELGKVEDILPNLLKEEIATNGSFKIVAVVDPPRSGLHSSVIRSLRDNLEINTILYVSCNPESLARDTLLLIEPLTDCPEEEGIAVSKPFKAERVVAVDMFPNTSHCEMLLKLVR